LGRNLAELKGNAVLPAKLGWHFS